MARKRYRKFTFRFCSPLKFGVQQVTIEADSGIDALDMLHERVPGAYSVVLVSGSRK